MTFTWVVSGRVPAGDFSSPVEDLVKDYVASSWNLLDPAISTNPPTDFSTKVRLGDFDYDYFSTYYIKIKEQVTTFDNDFIMAGLFGFQTPVLFEMSARRLTYGQSYQQLNNMRLEVIRIIGQYRPDDISGIPSMLIEDPGEAPEEGTTSSGQPVWYSKVTARVIYFKNYIET